MTKDSTVLRYATPDDSCLLSDYRLDQKRLGKFREAMLIFEGTHNFHNYTISKGLQERSIHRHLKSIKVSTLLPFFFVILNNNECVFLGE